MGIELPPELVEVARQAGVAWPQADEDKMRVAAKAWREAGTRIDTLATDADGHASTALHHVHGGAADAAGRHWHTFVAPDSGHLPSAARGCIDSADRLDHAADQVSAAKAQIVRNLVSLAKNSDAAHLAAHSGNPFALTGLTTMINGTAANVTHITHHLSRAVASGGSVAVGGPEPVNANPGVHAGPPGLLDNGAGQVGGGLPGQGHGHGHGVGLPLVDALLGNGAGPAGAGVPGTGQGQGGAVGQIVQTVLSTPGQAVHTVVGPVDAALAPLTGTPAGQPGPLTTVTDGVTHTVDHTAAAVGHTVDGTAGHVAAPVGHAVSDAGVPVVGTVDHGGAHVLGHDLPTPAAGIPAVNQTVQSASAAVLDAPPTAAAPAAPAPAAPVGPGPLSGGFDGGGQGAGGFGGGSSPAPTGGAPASGPVGGALGAAPLAAAAPARGAALPIAAPVTGGPVGSGIATDDGSRSGAPGSASTSGGGGARSGAPGAPNAPGAPGASTGGGQPGQGSGGSQQRGAAAGSTPGGPAQAGARAAGHQDGSVVAMPVGQLRAGADIERGPLSGVGSPAQGPADGAGATARPGGREQGEGLLALFLVRMFPIGHLPVATSRPARQLPPPPVELDYAAGLRFEPGDHPESALVDTRDRLADLRAGIAPPQPAAPVPADALTEGHDPLGELHERDWDRRFLVRDGEPVEYAWPPGEVYPEGGTAPAEPEVLEPGAVIDRFGTPDGRVFAEDGTPFALRSLPPSHLDAGYRRYQVLRPLPVWRSISAPWFAQPGCGTRYRTTHSAAELVLLGYLTELVA